MNKKRIERSISWQSVFAVVTILSIWAAYRMKAKKIFVTVFDLSRNKSTCRLSYSLST